MTSREVLNKVNQRRIHIEDPIETFNQIPSEGEEWVTEVFAIANDLLFVFESAI
jgi:hypothetical protein